MRRHFSVGAAAFPHFIERKMRPPPTPFLARYCPLHPPLPLPVLPFLRSPPRWEREAREHAGLFGQSTPQALRRSTSLLCRSFSQLAPRSEEDEEETYALLFWYFFDFVRSSECAPSPLHEQSSVVPLYFFRALGRLLLLAASPPPSRGPLPPQLLPPLPLSAARGTFFYLGVSGIPAMRAAA